MIIIIKQQVMHTYILWPVNMENVALLPVKYNSINLKIAIPKHITQINFCYSLQEIQFSFRIRIYK